MKGYKLYLFTRKKKETSVLKTHYNKILNLLMRKGLKNRQVCFFFNLLRGHKLKLRTKCFSKLNTYAFPKKCKKFKFPTFSQLLRVVFDLITLKLELVHKKFRKKEILIPAPISPWRGMRLGLNLLLKNSMNLIPSHKKKWKNKQCNQILTEFWRTFKRRSLTCVAINDFTLKVVDNSENYRFARLFPVNKQRRKVIPCSKLIRKKNINIIRKNRQKFLLFLTKTLRYANKHYSFKKNKMPVEINLKNNNKILTNNLNSCYKNYKRNLIVSYFKNYKYRKLNLKQEKKQQIIKLLKVNFKRMKTFLGKYNLKNILKLNSYLFLNNNNLSFKKLSYIRVQNFIKILNIQKTINGISKKTKSIYKKRKFNGFKINHNKTFFLRVNNSNKNILRSLRRRFKKYLTKLRIKYYLYTIIYRKLCYKKRIFCKLRYILCLRKHKLKKHKLKKKKLKKIKLKKIN